jgi:stage V sporulation protein D (sporulation-specific penicillin-binding protein)
LQAPTIASKKRLYLAFVMLFLALFSMIGRLGWIQFVRGEELQRRAYDQWIRDLPVEPKRGIIFDRRLRELAVSASAATVVARPSEIKEPEETAKALEGLLGMSYDTLYERLTTRRSEIYLKRRIDEDTRIEIQKLNLKGIHLTEESKRFYPHRNLASHILGFVGTDQGWSGVELIYDKFLRGEYGRIVSESDAAGRALPYGFQQYVPPVDGYNLVLTIDQVIQHIVESRLEEAVKEHNAKRGAVIVMDPNTGEILAMAAKPDFDPNFYQEFKQELWRNPIISDIYEPGSTFKIITAAAAIEEGLVKPTTTFNDPGFSLVAGHRIRCWKAGGHGHQNLIDVIKNSCNPGFIQIGQWIGRDKFYDYINAFGFGVKTGIDLPGESASLVLPRERVGPVELATISFGQGISSTPLQLITAISAIANGGTLYQPHVVKTIMDNSGKVVEEFVPKKVRQVISQETSKELTNYLIQAVEDGTGRNAKIAGHSVAGKTGTSETYRTGKYIASFAGFVPADNPKLAVLTIIYEPSSYSYYGGQLAAPLFKEIAIDILKYLDIKPKGTVKEPQKAEIPDITGLSIAEAQLKLRQKGFVAKLEGRGDIITHQTPRSGVWIPTGSTIIIYAQQDVEKVGTVVVPDLKGQSIKSASDALNILGLKIDLSGTGVVKEQFPKPGSVVEVGTTVVVQFERP